VSAMPNGSPPSCRSEVGAGSLGRELGNLHRVAGEKVRVKTAVDGHVRVDGTDDDLPPQPKASGPLGLDLSRSCRPRGMSRAPVQCTSGGIGPPIQCLVQRS
jgi:hypothetical protein